MGGQGKTRGAFGFALNFFAPLFSLERKKWKTYFRRKDRKSKVYRSNASSGSAGQSTRSKRDSSQADDETAIWAFEKVHYRTMRCRIKSGMTAQKTVTIVNRSVIEKC